MEIIALLVLIGLFYWVVKIPYEIVKFLFTLLYVIINKIRILYINKL